MKYSIDTSAILDARVRYYAPDVFPGPWEKLEKLIETGGLIATRLVLIELEQKDDEVCQWGRSRERMFTDVDLRIQAKAKDILRTHGRLVDDRRIGVQADVFVIALANLEGCAVVTGERPAREHEKKLKIPDVCRALRIQCLDMLGLFRKEGWRF